MMSRLRQLLFPQFQPRRMNTVAIPKFDEGRHLIHRHPVLHQVLKLACCVARILTERLRGRLVLPSALVFQHLRQIPVKKCAERLNPSLQQRLTVAPIVVNALLIRLPCPIRENARPRHRKPARRQAHRFHQRNIFGEPVIGIRRNVSGIPLVRLSRCMRERIPDRSAPAILMHRTFNLVRSRSRTPQETLRKAPIHRGSFYRSRPCPTHRRSVNATRR